MPELYRQALEAWKADDLPSVFDLINQAMQSPASTDRKSVV